MDNYPKHLGQDRRAPGFRAWVFRFLLENHKVMGFMAGWAAYPIGTALLCLLLP